MAGIGGTAASFLWDGRSMILTTVLVVADYMTESRKNRECGSMISGKGK